MQVMFVDGMHSYLNCFKVRDCEIVFYTDIVMFKEHIVSYRVTDIFTRV